ncbi:cytochrome P450 4F12-like [Glandiceps talaboti]
MAVFTATSVSLGLSIVVILLASLVVRFFNFVRHSRKEEKLLAEYPCPPKHWFYGHVMGIFDEKRMQWLERLTNKYSQCFQIHIGPFRRTLNLVHPDTVKTVFATQEPKNDINARFFKEWLGDGLLLSTDQKWFRNRRLLTPAFHFDILKQYFQVYNKSTRVMLEMWQQLDSNEPVELFRYTALLTLDSLLKCIFSMETNCQHTGEQDEYFKAVHDFGTLVILRMNDWKLRFMGKWLFEHFTHQGRKWRQALNTLHGYSRQVIERRLQELNSGEKSDKEYMDFLDILFAARDQDGKGLSYQEIQEEVDTFMFAGHDTTSSGISWILYNLARHPTYQQKCRQEIDAILDEKENDELEWNDIPKIPFTTMCIKESLRIHPPVPKVSRLITKPYTFPDGKVLHPGVTTVLDINSLHHNPHVWENPEVFDPMRFSPENRKDRPPHAYVPFAAGPRNCIGQNFALNEMKVATALVLRHFELTISGCPPPIRQTKAVLRAENGIYVKVKPRNIQQ